jgi:hypothetical protein
MFCVHQLLLSSAFRDALRCGPVSGTPVIAITGPAFGAKKATAKKGFPVAATFNDNNGFQIGRIYLLRWVAGVKDSNRQRHESQGDSVKFC